MPELSLSALGLTLSRGGRLVLADLDIAVAGGSALLLRGPNGIGKSSALMALAGLLPLETGKPGLVGLGPDDPASHYLHYVGHAPGIKPGLSVFENLRFWVDVMSGAPERMGSALASAGLDGLEEIDAGLLSAGQVRRLALARLLAIPRPLWLLDEPTNALDGQGIAWVGQLVSDHLAEGGLAVIATHLDIEIAGRVETLNLARRAA